MRVLSEIKDPVFVKPEKYNFIDRFWLSLIRDERDLPFIYLTLKISLIMIPVGLALYFPMPTWAWWTLAIVYLYLNNIAFKGPFGLMLHCTSHRKFFKRKYQLLNNYLPWVVAPFFGQTPETYSSHHLGMHHLENNLEDDESTTMYYQRDSLGSFFRYFGNFLFFGVITTVRYFHKKNRYKFRNKVLRGETLFFVVCGLLCLVSIKATIWVFLLPFLISRLVMMMGNFAQHSFVDFEDPGNCYKNSITCINTPYNKKCWNDGYHIDHHLRPAMHWTNYPLHFREHLDEFADNKALVFENLDFLKVWWLLMHKKYQKLADHVVNINGIFASDQEAIDLMKARTRKMPKRGITMENYDTKVAAVISPA